MLSGFFAKTLNLKDLITQGWQDMAKASHGNGAEDYKRILQEISDPEFNEKYFVKFLKCFEQGWGGINEEYTLKRRLENSKTLPEKYTAEKALKEHYTFYDFKNPKFKAKSTEYDRIYPFMVKQLTESWVKEKFIEANLAAVLLVGIHPKHKIDYSNLIKISNTESNKLILWAFLNITLKVWENDGLWLSDGSKAILINSMVEHRYNKYIENSLLPII